MRRYFALCLFAFAAVAQTLPEGAGKQTFANVCSQCHALDQATTLRLSRAEWQTKVDEMAALGAPASKEEFAAIVNYLATNFGRPDGAKPVITADASKVMPEGAGKTIILRECTACHLPSHFTQYRHTDEEWQGIVGRMGPRVRSATREELDTIQKYLATNYPKVQDTGKINVNKAAVAELAAQLSLSAAEAEAIVQYRQRHGDFKEWGELLAIYGVDGYKIEAAKDRMSF